MHQMSEERGRTLALIARNSIEAALGASLQKHPEGAWLRELAATFVTITRRGRLHGCIGSIEARRPLVEDVKQNAVGAALYDPRGTPLTLDLVVELRIEISRLSPLSPVPFVDEASALSALRPHIDGVVFEHQGRRATFLPQVWESLPDAGEFMAHLKQKAGFRAGFWSPDVKLSRYSLEKWKEHGPPEAVE